MLSSTRHRVRAGVALSLVALAAVAVHSPAADAKRKRTQPVLSLRTETNASTVVVGDQFQVDLVITVRTNAPVEELRLPAFDGFTVLRDSRSQRSSVQLVKGRRSVTLEQRYSYVLSADAPGVFQIGAASARLGTNRARSEPVKIRVVDENGKVGSNKVSPKQKLEDAREPFFLDVSFDRDQVYVGQQATLLVQVYAQQAIDARDLEMPKLPKFWVDKLNVSGSRPTERTIGGRRYYVYNLHGAALFPLEAGEHVVGRVSITVSTGSGFWARGRSYKLNSQPITLTVLPLPDEGRPADFEPGNVGRWNLTARLSPPRTEAGQPVTLTIEAVGEGNASAVVLPRLPESLEGLRLFPPTFAEDKGVTQGLLQGKKRAEILVQPLKEGRIRIPQLSLHYFDPVAGRYDVARSRPLTLLVGPADGTAPQASAGLQPSRSSIAQQARPVRTGLVPGSVTPLYRAGAFPFAVALLSVLAGGVLLFGQRRRQLSQGAGAKRNKALVYNRGALTQALQHGNLRQVQGALLQHLGLLFGDEVKALPHTELGPYLMSKGVSSVHATEAAALLSDLEAVLYAPASSADKQRLAERAKALFDQLEGAA